jgi:uncharacterized membrane protein YciS (DUF1049 family)
MSIKTIFVIIVSALATIILMKNTDEVTFWIFGNMYISKLAILGIMFALGFIVGIIVARPSRKHIPVEPELEKNYQEDKTDFLSDEDKEYIS